MCPVCVHGSSRLDIGHQPAAVRVHHRHQRPAGGVRRLPRPRRPCAGPGRAGPAPRRASHARRLARRPGSSWPSCSAASWARTRAACERYRSAMSPVISVVTRDRWSSWVRHEVVKIAAVSVAAASTAAWASMSPTTTGRAALGVGADVPHRYVASAAIAAASRSTTLPSAIVERRVTECLRRTGCRRSATARPPAPATPGTGSREAEQHRRCWCSTPCRWSRR